MFVRQSGQACFRTAPMSGVYVVIGFIYVHILVVFVQALLATLQGILSLYLHVYSLLKLLLALFFRSLFAFMSGALITCLHCYNFFYLFLIIHTCCCWYVLEIKWFILALFLSVLLSKCMRSLLVFDA